MSSATLDAVLLHEAHEATAVSEVRAWARSKGLAVNARGPLSASVRHAYERAHPPVKPLRRTRNSLPVLTPLAVRRVPAFSRPAAGVSTRWPSAGLLHHDEPDAFGEQSDAAWDARFARWQDAAREPAVSAPRPKPRAARWVRLVRSARR